MTSFLPNLLVSADKDDVISTQGTGNNPFDKFARVLAEWQGPIATFGLVIAAVAGVALLVMMMISGEQMRARIKKHLVVIVLCVVGLLMVSYVVSYAKKTGSQFGNGQNVGSILPSLKMYLGEIFPTIF